MQIGVARNCATLIEQDVEIVAPGVGKTVCWECGGDGDWTKFYPYPEDLDGPLACVECKGSGFRFVDAWAPPSAK